MSRTPFLSFVFLAALSLARPAAAQCQLADNLDGGPCCGLTQAALPNFGGFTQNFIQVCWKDCAVDQLYAFTARWAPIQILPGQIPPCGELRMRLDVLGPGNVLFWRGPMRLQYARTWLASDANGIPHQVWRFLVNGDLRPTAAAGATPCHVFPCVAPNGNRAHFTGYLDFAQDCAIPGNTEYAWMLTHACDALDHHAGFPRAGVFHPDRSYSFVAPMAGFVPGPIQPTEGTPFSPFESVRGRTLTPAPVTLACTFEEQAIHSLIPKSQLCFCGLPGSTQFLLADVLIQTACGTTIANPPVGPLLPGFVSMGIGDWTNPSAYPGQQHLRWNAAGYDYLDACVGTPQHEIFYGVTTIGGYPATQLVGGLPGAPLPPIFVDQANSVKPNGSVTMNVPFNSRHIVNLSH